MKNSAVALLVELNDVDIAPAQTELKLTGLIDGLVPEVSSDADWMEVWRSAMQKLLPSLPAEALPTEVPNVVLIERINGLINAMSSGLAKLTPNRMETAWASAGDYILATILADGEYKGESVFAVAADGVSE